MESFCCRAHGQLHFDAVEKKQRKIQGMLQQSAQIQSESVGSPTVCARIPIQIKARPFHILFTSIAKHGGLARVPITIQILSRRTQVLDHTAEHIVLLDIFQDLVAARRQGYGDALEKRSDVAGQATRPLVRLQLDAKVRVLPI